MGIWCCLAVLALLFLEPFKKGIHLYLDFIVCLVVFAILKTILNLPIFGTNYVLCEEVYQKKYLPESIERIVLEYFVCDHLVKFRCRPKVKSFI